MLQTYGYVGYNPLNGTIVTAYRGTSNDLNWLDDFDFWMVDYPGFPGAKIHMVSRLHWQYTDLIYSQTICIA